MRMELVMTMILLAALTGGAQAESVRIARDEWGVPHVFAETEAGGAYGLGWAQAEDRLEQLLWNYRWGAGTMAEAFGPDWLEHDWRAHLVGHQEVCREQYASVPADVRAALEAFQRGVMDYMADHPDEVPEWAPQIEPWQVLALGRSIIFEWPLGTAMSELERRDEVELPFSSNQWAVRPERTADGHAIMCIDPHIPWDGPFRFYEFRLHSGSLNLSGFGPVGSPTLGLGHNQHLAWANTTGGPDTTDVYVEECDPENPRRYRYDGEWREMTVRPVTIAVKGAEPVTREVESTHHGPVFLREGNRAYAVACPYFDQAGLVTQLYRMGQATSLSEFKDAVFMLQLMEQNTMVADVEGNIYYLRNGRVPIRPEGYDFTLPVPGNTSKTEWLGLYAPDRLVQIENPPQGYMQNNNCGPEFMMVGSPLRAEDYPPEVWGWGNDHSRSIRGRELLDAADRMTLEQAVAITLDTHAQGVEHCQVALRRAREGVPEQIIANEPGLAEALAAFMAWDGYLTAETTAGPFYKAFLEAARKAGIDFGPIYREEWLGDQQINAIRMAVLAAVRYLYDTYGTTLVAWGDLHRVRRGERSYPAAGGDGGSGSTLRAIGVQRDEETGIAYGESGQSWTQLVVLEPGNVRSFSATPYGQSDHPDSPHYFDQGEKLFSQLKLKETFFQPASLEGHIESERVLTFTP